MYNTIEIQSPNHLKLRHHYTSVFLGGSIEMGLAEDWQRKIINELQGQPIIFFNPRRSDWNSSWEQKSTNKPFKEQVVWELEALEVADVIIMYFDPNTKSPISLLELGLHAKEQKMIVVCPEGFWRKGNVDIVCEMYKIKQVESIDKLIELMKTTKIKDIPK